MLQLILTHKVDVSVIGMQNEITLYPGENYQIRATKQNQVLSIFLNNVVQSGIFRSNETYKFTIFLADHGLKSLPILLLCQ